MSKLLDKFGKRLRELRLSNSFTQEDLAYKADVSVYYISKLERGLANPSLETLQSISRALSVQLSELLKNI